MENLNFVLETIKTKYVNGENNITVVKENQRIENIKDIWYYKRK